MKKSGSTAKFGHVAKRKSKTFSDEPPPMEDSEQIVNCYCQRCKARHMGRVSVTEREKREVILRNIHSTIDERMDEAFNELHSFIEIKSVSSDEKCIEETVKVLDLMRLRLETLKFTVDEYNVDEKVSPFDDAPQQKVLFGSYFSSPMKNTLLIYAYLDVVPAEQKDGWLTDPFELVTSEGLMYGRGLTSGKGPAVSWMHTIDVWLDEYDDLPVNIKIIVEAMHEVGSVGLISYIELKREFFLDVDYIVFPCNSWLNDEQPIISCSLCGWAHFGLEMRGGNKTVDSGLAGGLIYEPMADISHLMNSLVDDDQAMQLPYLENLVRPIPASEWKLLESAQFSDYDYKEKLSVRRLKHEDTKVDLLENRWCKTTVTMHGVEGCYSGKGSQRSIPLGLLGKFSLKLFPNQDIQHTQLVVTDYLAQKHEEFKVHTRMRVHLLDGCDPIVWSYDSPHLLATRRAVQSAFKRDPAMTQSICTCMPIAAVFRKVTAKNIILLPFAKRMDRRVQINESISENWYICNTKLCASLLHELSLLTPKCKCDVIFDYCDRVGVAERIAMSHEIPAQSSIRVAVPRRTTMKAPIKKPKPPKPTDGGKQTTKPETSKDNFFKNLSCWPRKRK